MLFAITGLGEASHRDRLKTVDLMSLDNCKLMFLTCVIFMLNNKLDFQIEDISHTSNAPNNRGHHFK